jgi:tRNA threonylcarbamoyladenosine biosynthesis protein TsaB
MLLLAIDTSTRRVGIALGGSRGMLGAVEIGGPGIDEPPRHAERLAPAIEFLRAQVGVELTQLSAVAVAIGPGMFTGLRVGVTTAKVLAQALRVPVIPIPSLDLLAYPLRHAAGRLVAPAIDARRHEIYYAVYRPVPGGLQRETDYELGSPDDLASELAARGHDALLCGDGAIRFRAAFDGLDRVEFAGAGHAAPDLAALVELASGQYEREEFSLPADVHPLYLRRSDAELAWDSRGAATGW